MKRLAGTCASGECRDRPLAPSSDFATDRGWNWVGSNSLPLSSIRVTSVALLRCYHRSTSVQSTASTGGFDGRIIDALGLLTDGSKTNAYRAVVDPRGWTCGFISRADVAEFLVKQIVDDAFLHKTPVVTS